MEHYTSWLDHFVCSSDAHDALENMEVLYSYTTTDHRPPHRNIPGADLGILYGGGGGGSGPEFFEGGV